MADAQYAKAADVNMIEGIKILHNKGPMVETTEGFKQGVEKTEATEGLRVILQKNGIVDAPNMQVNMVVLGKDANTRAHEENTQKSEDQVKVSYPEKEESLVEFLHRYQRKKS